jgi:hypothetical protein
LPANAPDGWARAEEVPVSTDRKAAADWDRLRRRQITRITNNLAALHVDTEGIRSGVRALWNAHAEHDARKAAAFVRMLKRAAHVLIPAPTDTERSRLEKLDAAVAIFMSLAALDPTEGRF